jgi:hypothetical protein
MILQVLLLAGLALAMLRAASRLRGGQNHSDAFFPLVVLSLAGWECFLLELTLPLVGATVCAGAFLILLAGADPRIAPRQAVWMGACLVLMPLFGACGLVLVPALAAWLAFVGVLHVRGPEAGARRAGWLVLGLVAAALLLCGLYCVGLPALAQGPRAPAHGLVRRSLQVLGMLFGAAELPWRPLRLAAVALALLPGGAVWLAAWLGRPHERVLLLGWLAFLVAMGCLVAALARGRGDYLGQTPFVPRYSTLLVPLGCGMYFLHLRYGGATRGPAQMALLLLAAVVFAPNLRAAFDDGRCRRRALRDFEAGLTCRLPPALLAECGAGRVFQAEQRDDVDGYLRALRDSRTGAFGALPEDTPLASVALPGSPLPSDMNLSNGVARPVGDNPALTIALPRPRYVRAIRLRYDSSNGMGSADRFELTWQGPGQDGMVGRSKVLLEARGAAERTAIIGIDGRISTIHLVPRNKVFALRLRAIELLVPETPAER